jgi:hypothetical protein
VIVIRIDYYQDSQTALFDACDLSEEEKNIGETFEVTIDDIFICEQVEAGKNCTVKCSSVSLDTLQYRLSLFV